MIIFIFLTAFVIGFVVSDDGLVNILLAGWLFDGFNTIAKQIASFTIHANICKVFIRAKEDFVPVAALNEITSVSHTFVLCSVSALNYFGVCISVVESTKL